MPIVLFLLSMATLVAVSSKSKGRPAGGPTQTFTLDTNMPDALRNQVLAALVSGTDPATLDAFATAIQAQYPLSAGLLHAKAASLRASVPAAPSAPPLPATSDPGGPPLDALMPPAMVAFIHTELATESDPIKLLTLASTIAAQYPIASSLLTERAAVLNVQPSAPPTPIAPAPPPSPTPNPAPANPSAPAFNMPGLDPGMPPDVAQAVMGSLIGENDPAKLQALAQQLQGHYPLAAALVAQKASTLAALQHVVTPTPSPSPSPIPPSPSPSPPTVIPSGLPGLDANMPPETAQLVMSELVNEADPVKLQTLADELAPQYPIAAGLLRTRANVILATRPPIQIVPDPPTPTVLAALYTVKQGDFPWKIAEHYTQHGARWPELVAANPQKKRGKDGNFASLLAGEKITVPASWLVAAPSASAATPSVPATSPAAVPSVAPATAANDVALDASIPNDVGAAVRNALSSATDPVQVHGFATAIRQRGYPVAASLLDAKATSLSGASPTGMVLASVAPSPSAPSAASVATYKVKPGDSPSKIAAALVHDGNRWKELVAANPLKKRAKDGSFATLLPGELLQLPPSWSAHGAPANPSHVPQGGA